MNYGDVLFGMALRSGIDPKTGAWLGGWKNIRHFMETYAQAIRTSR